MKVFISNADDNIYVGGKSGFLKKLAFVLKKKGLSVSGDSSQKYDVSLGAISLPKVKAFKKILRLDGVYHNNKENFKSKNSSIKKNLQMADAVVYQSEFSKKICNTFLGKHKEENIIYNGNFLDFSPKKEIIDSYKRRFITVSKWRPHKRLKDIIESFIIMQDPQSCLYIGGDLSGSALTDKDMKIYSKISNIIFLGIISHEVLYDYLSVSDSFVHLCWFDNCPNSVVEAICKGLPVVTNNVGGTHEIVRKSGGKVCEIDSPYNFKPCDLYSPPKIDRGEVAKGMIESVELKGTIKKDFLDINFIAEQYINFFEKVLRKG